MLYAVTIEPLNTIFFVSERPDECEWEVQEGVSLDAAPLYGTWTAEREAFETNPLRFEFGPDILQALQKSKRHRP